MLLKIGKLIVLPLSAAIFKGLISDLYLVLLGLTFICVPILSLGLAFWTDFKSFESLRCFGIKNYYVVSVVKRELMYMKKL
ncbi:hypothetical protein J2Z52_001699 [Enterococcus rivorum]|uniref:Uncharacterized protein n=2 Tax=Enterococcus rivorum TaxID=762845 RepID=A0A1E5L0L4_9ENTE|nr:hypothetical protein [Enterococcus rivorum]OEH83611.1 hypothetical protein BCR26_09030 [Enterococcus rivorum]